MPTSTTLPDWALQRLPGPDRLSAWAVGLMGLDGETLYLNPGMQSLLGGDSPAEPRSTYFVNPCFHELVERARATPNDGLVFSGFLTLGDRYRDSHSLKARAWRHDRQLLISAEHDVHELDRLNQALTETNRQVNRLRHELLKKNRLLEHTLEKLTQAQAMLVHSEKMNALGQLVAGVAHEINNPLSFAVSNLYSLEESVTTLSRAYDDLEGLLRERDPDGAQDALAEVRAAHDLDFLLGDLEPLLAGASRGLARIDRILKQLRTFSRLDQAAVETIDLDEAIQAIIALAKASLREGGVEVTMDLDRLPTIECYASELNQVFMNLIVNAVQAMPEGGRLSIAGKEIDPVWVELSFADTGRGIPEDCLDRIFDPFFTTKPVGSGTGLGLSLAHQVVTERHGGRIAVRSTPGVGTTFTLTLPRSVTRRTDR